ncbi:sulfotransferase family 2 domain-containing protein [Nocardioides sp.]|uniref:sulfotransferase family 2 domain-containing protein n=1 Tax=Nocardioides sp. TaxID=35761 RepID=UPI0035676B8C
MLISDTHRFLFIHVQKTGGSTIDNNLSAALGDVRRIPEAHRHAPLERLLQLEPGLADYWIAGFVRNPWSRMVSWWRMVERFRDGADRGVERYLDHLKRNKFIASVIAEHPDFESFILNATAEHARLRKPQVEFMTTPTRDADFVGRQESLESDLKTIYDRLGLEWTPLESVNIDPGRPDYHDLYTPASRDRVAELFAADLSAYDYTF